jgi:hypothetical protein
LTVLSPTSPPCGSGCKAAGGILVDGLARQVKVLSADQAKGLEFDHVVVAEPAATAGRDEQWGNVYVARSAGARARAEEQHPL